MSLSQQITGSSANIEWHSDDGSTRVSLPTGLVDRIAGYVTDAYKSLPRRGAEAGGLLIGGVRIGPVTEIFITGFEPVVCDYAYGPAFILSEASQADFRAALSRHSSSEILGYYRSHTRKSPGLESSDRELVARIFPGLSGLILLIKPLPGAALAGSYYFFQRGSMEARRVGPEFPFAGNIPGGTPPLHPIQQSLELTPAPAEPKPETAAEPEHAETKRRKSLQWEIIAAGLMIAAALALLWWQYRGDSAAEDAATSQPVAAHVASLGLVVHPGDGGWRITWDPNTPAARNSVRGVLNVTEIVSHESIPLNAQQIRGGAATYRPVGDDITFRLELSGPGNTLASETYRVIRKPAVAPQETPLPVKPVPVKPAQKRESPPDESYVEPEVVNRVAPEVPDGIRPRITTPTPIDVRVSIDREGRVTSAAALQHGDGLVNYLGTRAVAAAKQWTFKPASQGGKAVPSSRTIHFVFEQ